VSGNRAVDEIFREALALEGEERDRFVRERCAGNAKLERRLFDLLRASQAPDEVLKRRFDTAREALWRSVVGADEHAGEDLSGQQIDIWRLTKRLARGGLATVYLAERADGAYEQTAAFKVLRRGLDTDDLIARFRAERQILSTLDHPSIAQILDGGALRDGRPYLVLEYVDGLPITAWCEQRQSRIDELIRLLMDVLQALHHAHKHLIVHRDIKPSNILVSSEGRISLLDFGIAKLLDPEAMPGASTLTRTGVSLLTPGYGSPEQHAGEPVTTASDVYQVGEVMYELLTGERPFGGSRQAGEDVTLLPSRVLRGQPRYNRVRGDLDAITAKATHVDPARRYASAADMREDLQRFLDHRPIQARPDTLRYRLGKLAHRRPWLIPVAIVAVLAVAGYITTLTIYARQLQIEQRRASAAQTFLVDLLRSPDPFAPADPERGQEITVVEALDLGVERLAAGSYDDPELRTSLLNSIASVYASLDRHDSAIELRAESLALERKLYGDVSPQVVESLVMLAERYRALADYERAFEYFDDQLEIARRIYGSDDPALGAAEAAKAEIYFLQGFGNQAEAMQLLESGIGKMRNAPAEYSRHLINAFVALAYLQSEDQHQAALASLAEALELSDRYYGPDSLSAALIHAQAATTWSTYADYDRAETEFHKALAIYEAKIGPDHATTISALNNLGVLALRTGDFARSEEIFREILERYKRKYGTEHQIIADTYQNLATVLTHQGRYEESIPMHRKAVEVYDAVLPEDHFVAAYPRMSLAYAYIELGEFAAAGDWAVQAHELLRKAAPDTWMAGVAQCLVGAALEGSGRRQEGVALIEAAHALLVNSGVGPPYRELCRVPTG
jgi:serine/threonine-protein kinase